GRTKTQWEIGSAAEPPGLPELLLERGLVHDRDPYAVALVLTEAPPQGPPGIEARAVATFEEFAAATEVQWEAFGTPEDEIAEARELLADRWRDSPLVMHAAWLDGRIVSAGTCAATEHGLLLYGGAHGAEAPGRRAHGALLRAR